MRPVKLLLFTLTLSVLNSFAPALAASFTLLSFESSPSSFIGQGESVLVTEEEFSFTPSRNFDNGVSFDIRNLDFLNAPPNRRNWRLDLAAPFEVELTPGFFDNAARFPFQDPSQPGLSFTGNGRAANTVSGFFEVLQAVYSTDGSVESFAVDFTLFEEEILDRRIDGQLRFNSSFNLNGISVPEPSTAIGTFAAAAFLAGVIKSKRHSRTLMQTSSRQQGEDRNV